MALTFALIARFKTPKFHDSFFVRTEMAYLINAVFICGLIHTIMTLLGAQSGNIYYEIQTSTLTVANLCNILISESFVLKKVLNLDDIYYDYGKLKMQTTASSHSSIAPSNTVLQLMRP
eukprot:383070_1